MDEFATLLRVIEAWDHISQELVLDAEITLEVKIEELEELFLELLCGTTFGEGEVLIVGKLAEILG